MLSTMTDSTPKFLISQFLLALVTHSSFLFANVLAIPFMLLFTNYAFLKNAGLAPSSSISCIFFCIQTYQGICFMGVFVSFCINRYGTDDDHPKLSPIPVATALTMAFTRFFIISARYGITSAKKVLR